MPQRKLFTQKELIDSINSISEELEKPITGYLIGGLAMIFHGAKAVTKDVDVIFNNAKEARIFIDALKKCGFTQQTNLPDEYLQLNTTYVFKNSSDHQFDIFVCQVCNGLYLSNDMIENSTIAYSNKKLTLNALSLNSIFLFKGITERPHDLDDMFIIAGKVIEWEIIEEELRKQPESWKWLCQYHGRLLELLEKFQLESPSIKRLQEEADESRAMCSILSIVQNGPKTEEQIISFEIIDEKEYLLHVIKKLIDLKLIHKQDGTLIATG
jgi:hypothetical protein